MVGVVAFSKAEHFRRRWPLATGRSLTRPFREYPLISTVGTGFLDSVSFFSIIIYVRVRHSLPWFDAPCKPLLIGIKRFIPLKGALRGLKVHSAIEKSFPPVKAHNAGETIHCVEQRCIRQKHSPVTTSESSSVSFVFARLPPVPS
jgi:hypothetical protein